MPCPSGVWQTWFGVHVKPCAHGYNYSLWHAGNYDTYVRTRGELEENQMKKFKWEQEQIKDMKEYIARFGHGSAKLARQAQSKEKTLAKMVRSCSCTHDE